MSHLNTHEAILPFILKELDTKAYQSMQINLLENQEIQNEFADLKISIDFLENLDLSPSSSFTDRMMAKLAAQSDYLINEKDY